MTTTHNAGDPQDKSSTSSSDCGRGAWLIRGSINAVVGAIGALLSWKAMGLIGAVATLPADLAGLAFGQVPSPEDQARLSSAIYSVSLKNTAIWMSVTGAILGLLLGVSTGLSRRLCFKITLTVASTIFCGALFGALAGISAVSINEVVRQNMDPAATTPPEQFTIAMHGTTWLIVGLGLGLGAAFGQTQPWRSRAEFVVVTGLAGMVAGGAFPIVAGLLFPAVNSTFPVPATDPDVGRILWLSLPSVLVGLVIGRCR